MCPHDLQLHDETSYVICGMFVGHKRPVIVSDKKLIILDTFEKWLFNYLALDHSQISKALVIEKKLLYLLCFVDFLTDLFYYCIRCLKSFIYLSAVMKKVNFSQRNGPNSRKRFVGAVFRDRTRHLLRVKRKRMSHDN